MTSALAKKVMGACAAVVLGLHLGSAAAAQNATAPAPVDAVDAIIDAFRTHNVVAITDPHGNVQVQRFLLSLIRDPRLPTVAHDIVLESLSARYQDVVDRYVRGDAVDRALVQRAWRDHAVPNGLLDTHAEELLDAVREINKAHAPGAQLRVIAGDPPIDWDNVTSVQDHRRWIELRDSYPADLIRRQVLDRRRRALVVYGQLHLQRRQIGANYDMTEWQAQTVASLLLVNPDVRMLNIWTLVDPAIPVPEVVAGWRAPSLALVQGTTLGATAFDQYTPARGRFGFRSGKVVPIPKDDWRPRAMEEQFDVVLYLGPPSAMTFRTMAPALCRDQEFIAERLRRIALAGLPPVEAETVKKACGLP